MSEKNAATDTVNPIERKSRQLSAMFTPEEIDLIEDYRWDNRLERVSDVLKRAVIQLVTPKG